MSSVGLRGQAESMFHCLIVQPALSPAGARIAAAIQTGPGAIPLAVVPCPWTEKWDIIKITTVGGVVAGCGDSYVELFINGFGQATNLLASQVSLALTDRMKISRSVVIPPGGTLSVFGVQIAAAVAGGIQDFDLQVLRTAT